MTINQLTADLDNRIIKSEGEPPLFFSKSDLIDACIRLIAETKPREKPIMVLPVDLPKDTKKNKVRLIESDRLSPLGNVIKNNFYSTEVYKTAAAEFNGFDMLAWLYEQED